MYWICNENMDCVDNKVIFKGGCIGVLVCVREAHTCVHICVCMFVCVWLFYDVLAMKMNTCWVQFTVTDVIQKKKKIFKKKRKNTSGSQSMFCA